VTVLRSLLFNIFFFVATFVLTVLAYVVSLIDPDRAYGYAVRWARVILWGLRRICRIEVEVIGAEHLPRGAALIASAHQSAFDTLIWLTLVPRCCYVLKRELLRIPLFGRLIVKAGMIPIDRSSGQSAIRSLLRQADRAVREERQIVIFPQGTRIAPGKSVALQPGVAALADRTRLPVIPIATDSGLYWSRRAFHKRPGTIRVVVRPPLPNGLRRPDLMARLSDAIRLSGCEPRAAADGASGSAGMSVG
jgi:1-acyl-sn-glycerol-3-phosphate acyltransferase